MMNVKVYRIRGCIRLRTGESQKFSIELSAMKKEHALEKLYSLLGSRHKAKRSHIKIESVEEIRPEEAKSSYIRDLLSLEVLVK